MTQSQFGVVPERFIAKISSWLNNSFCMRKPLNIVFSAGVRKAIKRTLLLIAEAVAVIKNNAF